ncbi:MAG: hypothetical protein AB8B85_23470 [Paracoccaceae bacterium]
MIRALVLLATLLPAGAHALSCSPPNAAGHVHHELDDPHLLVLHGTLKPRGALPKRIDYETIWAKADFTGFELSALGKKPVRYPIQIAASCIASWCADLPTSTISGLFVLGTYETAPAPVLDLNACGFGVYPEPDQSQTDILLRCLREGGCAYADIEAFDPY